MELRVSGRSPRNTMEGRGQIYMKYISMGEKSIRGLGNRVQVK